MAWSLAALEKASMSRPAPGKEAKTVEGKLLLYVAWGLTAIAGCLVIVSPLFDGGGDQWRGLAAAALCAAMLCLAGYVASGGLL